MTDTLTILLLGLGVIFFMSGTLGILRFPDLYSRLHALTKADNLGLGFIIAALVLQSVSIFEVVKLIVIWLIALLSAATIAQLIATYCRRHDGERE